MIGMALNAMRIFGEVVKVAVDGVGAEFVVIP